MTIQKFNLDSKLDIIRNEVFLKNMRSAIADSFDEMNTWMGKVDDNVVEAIKDKAIKYNHLADNSVGYNQQKIHEGIVWNYGNINVDTVNKTVSINNNTFIGYSNKNIIAPAQTLTWEGTSAQWLYVDVFTGELLLFENADNRVNDETRLAFICVIYNNRVHGLNKEKIKVDGVYGGDSYIKAYQEGIIYPAYGERILIKYDDKSYTISVEYNEEEMPYILDKFGWHIMHESHINDSNRKTVKTVEESKYGYLYNLFVNRKTKALEFYDYTTTLTPTQVVDLVYLCSFNKNYFVGCHGAENNITINGKKMNERDVWDKKTRFILPNDLFFIKGIDYSLISPSLINNKIYNNNEIGFEMCLPTKTIEFTTNADLNFNVEGVFESKIGAKHNKEDVAIYKDINLHIKDASKVSNKNPKILCIGDSITNTNFPSHCKWWLSNFGINATMIGTQNNRNDYYKYGISKNFASNYAKGEGYSTWRLSDFVCKTVDNNGLPILRSNNPFMNPQTNEFDFTYYMNNNNFDNVDYVIINLGTNDITGANLDASAKKLSIEENLSSLKSWYDIMINSIHKFNPNIKIGINPPLTSERATWEGKTFNECSELWAEKIIDLYKNTKNVQVLSAYLGMGNLIVSSNVGINKPIVQAGNDTYKHAVSTDVHPNGMGQLIHSLWTISWIVNSL